MTTVPHHHDDTHPAHVPASSVPFWQLLGTGAVTLFFGVAVLMRPDATVRLLGILAGVWLIAMGLMRVISAFDRSHRMIRQLLDGVLGVILLVIGVACLRNMVTGVVALAVIIGLAWILSGFAELLLALLSRGRARVWLLLLAAASTVVGVLFLAWPGLSVRALVLLTAVSALALGVGEIVLALQTRRAVEPDR